MKSVGLVFTEDINTLPFFSSLFTIIAHTWTCVQHHLNSFNVFESYFFSSFNPSFCNFVGFFSVVTFVVCNVGSKKSFSIESSMYVFYSWNNVSIKPFIFCFKLYHTLSFLIAILLQVKIGRTTKY